METPRTYMCPRCGATITDSVDAVRQYCALCGISAFELRHIRYPADTRSYTGKDRTRAPSGLYKAVEIEDEQQVA